MSIKLRFNHLINKRSFHEFPIDNEFFYEMLYNFEEYCKTQGTFFQGNIFGYEFVQEFLKEVKTDKVSFNFSNYQVKINDEIIQFPKFKTYIDLEILIENYYITLLYFKFINYDGN